MASTHHGVCFTGMTKDRDYYELLPNNIHKVVHGPGFYFIYAKLKKTDSMVIVYCGQSLASIKSRLSDHYKKLNTSGEDWNMWGQTNSANIESMYFSTFTTDYGAAYENFVIYYSVVGITFCLNRSLNGHANSLIDIHNVNFSLQTPFAKFVNTLQQNCNQLLISAAVGTSKALRGTKVDQPYSVVQPSSVVQSSSTIAKVNDMTLPEFYAAHGDDLKSESEVTPFSTITKVNNMTLQEFYAVHKECLT